MILLGNLNFALPGKPGIGFGSNSFLRKNPKPARGIVKRGEWGGGQQFS